MASGETFPEVAPTELEVLKVMWDAGRLSAREVHDRLGAEQGWAYSTTRTVLDRMVKKGLASRASFHGVFLYQPGISRPLGLARLVRDFAERVLELDGAAVMPLLTRSDALSREEVAELSRLLETADAAKDPAAKDTAATGTAATDTAATGTAATDTAATDTAATERATP